MILACPNCTARYRVEAAALGAAGRRVRCGRCGHVWHAEPPGHVVELLHAEPEPAPPAPAKPQLPAPARPASGPRPRSRWIWMLCLAVLAACVIGYEARRSVVGEWPWLAPVYEALGIEVSEEPDSRPAG